MVSLPFAMPAAPEILAPHSSPAPAAEVPRLCEAEGVPSNSPPHLFTSSPLPLSNHDSTLFSTYIANHLNLELLSAATNTPIATLIDWVQRPDIKQRTEAFQQSQLASANTTLLAHTLQTRLTLIKQLEARLPTVTDPAEFRRAANLLLRYITPIKLPTTHAPRAHTPRPQPVPRQHPAHSSPAPAAEVPSPRGTGPHSSPGSAGEVPTPCEAEGVPSKPLPTFPTPASLLDHVETILTTHSRANPAATLTRLHALFADGAHVNQMPVPGNPDRFARARDACDAHLLLGACAFLSDSETEHDGTVTARTRILRPGHQPTHATFTLTRDSPAATWRIAALTTTRNSS